MDFAKAYRQCRRTQALRRGISAVQNCLAGFHEEFLLVEEEALKSFVDIHGYRISTADGIAFFPRDISEVKANTGLSYLREAFRSVDIVIPPYIGLGYLHQSAFNISSAEGHDAKMTCGDTMLEEVYAADTMSRLIVDVIKKQEAFDQFGEQVIEAVKAYFLGLYGVAIVGVLPCIEGVVRKLGVLSGITVSDSVDIASLLKVFRRLKQKELDGLVGDYAWYPAHEINIALLDRFHERVQMLESIEVYFRDRFYMHTKGLSESVTLNRHGIAHGFFEGYATQHNFLRLFCLLCALSFAAIMVKGRGSLFGPAPTPEAAALELRFGRCVVSANFFR